MIYDLQKVLFVCYLFFNDTATTEIYTLSLHDALPILLEKPQPGCPHPPAPPLPAPELDRKSTRLNSSHMSISYAVFCLKKKIPRWKTIFSIKPSPSFDL